MRDARFPSDLPNGPYRITRYVAYDAPVGDPLHRFFQMWQQIDGGKMDLFTWVAVSSGEGSRTRDDPSSDTNQGGEAMGFYSMSSGDAPYFRELARAYALADNYHQPIMGGTGPNFLALSTGYAGMYLDAGKPALRPQIRSRIPIRVRVPTTGTSGRVMAEAPTRRARIQTSPASGQSGTTSRRSRIEHSTTAIAPPTPIIW